MALSRRKFLGGLALTPFLAQLTNAAPMEHSMRVVVIGAGVFGGWTALHLRGAGADVELIDAWGAGNPRASSGGETRVIRAIYGPDRLYAEMVMSAYPQWEKLSALSQEPVYAETGTLWLHRGDDGYVKSSLPIMKEVGFPVDQLSIEETRRRYPQIKLDAIRSVYFERRAGALSARRACGIVRDEFVKSGGRYRTAQARPGPIVNGKMAALELGNGERVSADVFVFACGPWLGQIFPTLLGQAILPTKQDVFYFGTPAGSERYKPPALPIWIDFGERIFYGIPDVHGRGFKIADDTRGEAFDPTSGERAPSKEALARARALIAKRFPELTNSPLLHAEVCQYENSPDGHLIIDRHPEAANVIIAGGGSGHGFKLGPAVGEMVARKIVADAATPELFSLERLRQKSKLSTQFEKKW